MAENRTEAQSASRKMIRVDLTRSLQAIGLPLIRFEKDGQTLRFLLDTGASMNLIKKEVLAQFRDDADQLPQRMEYYGIDNVCHETHLYSFKFKLGEYVYSEVFQEMQNADALVFELEQGSVEVHGILSSQFFMKYHACFSYETMEMFFATPDCLS